MKKTAKTGTVTDEQGRVRFHGAFTGGFSAGYFNTVGSSEGFQPAQFVSSRSNRASQQNGRSIADYMDEGDGLLGGKLSSVAGIDSFAHTATDHLSNGLEADRENLMNRQLLSELTVQVKPSDTIGKKLLATMGWRLGQGIGPRVPKKRVDYFSSSQKTSLTMEIHPGADLSKLPQSAFLKSGSVTFAPDDEGKKVAIPAPKLDMYGLGFDVRLSGRLGVPSQENDYSVDLEDEDAYEGSNNTYRMSDVLTANTRGSNTHKPNPAAKRSVPYGQQPSQANKRLKYSSGFAYNDEEDDVYSSAPLALTNSIDASAEMSSSVVLFGQSNYNNSFVEDTQRQKKLQENAQETLQNINQSVESWLGGDPSNPHAGVSSVKGDLSQTLTAVERCPSDNRPPLPGFHVARRPRVPPPHYPPPVVPADFHPYHTFTKEGEKESGPASGAGFSTRGRKQNPLDAAKARSDKMNEDVPLKAGENVNAATVANTDASSAEPPKKASIFDLIKPEARLKLQSAINAVNPTSQVQLVPPTSVITDKPPLPPRPATPPLPPPPPAPPSLSSSLPPNSTGEAPPARPMLTSSHLLTSTFAGLSQAFKNRFATATTTEGAGTKDSIVLEGIATASEYTKKLAEKAEIKASEDATLSAKNAPKVFHLKGITRTVTPWAPSPLLCKRMNVRLPDIAKTSAQLGTLTNGDAPTLDPVRQLLVGINPNAEQPVLQFGRGADGTAAEMRREEEESRALEAEKLDVYQAPPEIKPDISVFKSIFEDSEDEEEEGESENEEDPADGEGKDGESSKKNGENTAPIPSTHLLPAPAKPSAPSAVVSAPKLMEQAAQEESGPVRFVPSKLRTTIAGRTGSTTTGAAPGKARGATRSRTSFEDPDQDDDGDGEVVLHRSQGRTAAGKLSASASASASAGVSDNIDEGTEDGMQSSNPRGASQNTVSIGGAGLAGRARKGRTAAAGSLRERLLAQQRAELEESVPAPEPENEAQSRNKSANTVTKKVVSSMAPENMEESNKSHQAVTQSVLVAQSIRSKMNSNAAEDFLADLSAATIPSFVADPTSLKMQQESSSAEPAVWTGQAEVSVLPAPLQDAPIAVHRPSSRFAPPPPPRPPTPPVQAVVAQHDGHGRRNHGAVNEPMHVDRPGRVFTEQKAPPADAMPSSASLHEGPLPPPPPARDLPLPPAQNRSATSATPSVMADAVLPPAAKFETSIQRLQNSLLGPDAEKDRSSKKSSKKEHKKSHKSHKSDKHKHKKDSSKKKDRKRDKKESSKKSKKSRNNDSSSSDDSSDGSSSESD